MNPLSILPAIEKAQRAIDEANKIRAEKVSTALLSFAAEARAVHSADLPDVINRHRPLLLAASSQGSAFREMAKAFGLGDMVKGLVDRLESRE